MKDAEILPFAKKTAMVTIDAEILHPVPWINFVKIYLFGKSVKCSQLLKNKDGTDGLLDVIFSKVQKAVKYLRGDYLNFKEILRSLKKE